MTPIGAPLPAVGNRRPRDVQQEPGRLSLVRSTLLQIQKGSFAWILQGGAPSTQHGIDLIRGSSNHFTNSADVRQQNLQISTT